MLATDVPFSSATILTSRELGMDPMLGKVEARCWRRIVANVVGSIHNVSTDTA